MRISLLLFIFFSFLITKINAQKLIPIKGTYIESPFVTQTSSSFDSTWSKIVDFLIIQGYSLKLVEKASGLIMTERIPLKYTTEIKKNAKLTDTTALIVVSQLYEPGPNRYSPITKHSDITGEINIRIKDIDGATVITINFVNLKYQVRDNYYRTFREQSLSEFQSTGKIEKMVQIYLKNK